MNNKFLTVIYDMSQPGMAEKSQNILRAADWTASGWSHAFNDRDDARHAMYRLEEQSSWVKEHATLPQKMTEEMREAMWEALTRHGSANLEYWIEDLYNDIRNAAIAAKASE